MNLLVTDFDGTFYDNNYDRNIELIRKYKKIVYYFIEGHLFL